MIGPKISFCQRSPRLLEQKAGTQIFSAIVGIFCRSTPSRVCSGSVQNGTFWPDVCGATLLVNMRDIEPRKEDDGFDGAFLSP